MAKYYDEIPEWLLEWIQKQHMFWVASAPLNIHGHVNVSPKGTADCFHVVNSKQVWYEDLSGSGIETISHIRENGRVTIMFSAFEGPARILRLFGVGTVHEYGTPEYNTLIPTETRKPGSRAAIVVDVYQVGASCGYAVPIYDFVTHRTQLLKFFVKHEAGDRLLATSKESEQAEQQPIPTCDIKDDIKNKGATPRSSSLRGYWLLKNMRSLDGLPGLVTAPNAVLGMVPQSHLDNDTQPMKLHRKGMANDSLPDLVFGDQMNFASGFMTGAVVVLAFVTVLGRLKL